MQSKKIVLSALFLALPLSATANDVMGVYVSGKAGTSLQSVSAKDENGKTKSKTYNGFGGGVAVGYDFNPEFNTPFRVELEYYARSGKKVSGNYDDLDDSRVTGRDDADSENTAGKKSITLSTQTLMANGYWDIYTDVEGLRPFLSVGLGSAFNKFEYKAPGQSASKTTTNFAWAVGAGVGYDFTPNWAVELGYRYLNAGKALKESDIKVAYHDINLGLRYTF